MSQTKITREIVEKDAIPDSQMRIRTKLQYCEQTTRLVNSLSRPDLEAYVHYGREFQRAQERKGQENLTSRYGDFMFFYERLTLMEEKLALARLRTSLLDKMEE